MMHNRSLTLADKQPAKTFAKKKSRQRASVKTKQTRTDI